MTKFHVVFQVGTGTLYASSYPFCDSTDFMNDCEPVCDGFSGISDHRLAGLLTECLFYSHWLDEQPTGKERAWVIKHLYSREQRIVKHTGRFALRSILETLNVTNLIGVPS